MSSAPEISAAAPAAARSDHRADYRADYRSIALLSGSHFCDDINQGVVPAMLPFFIAAYHLSYAAAAGLVLAQTLFSSVAQPLFGLMADRRPSPWLIPVGLSFAGIGVALTGLTHTYNLIFAAIAISGLGISAFHPEAARRVRYLGGMRAATSMSFFTVGGMAGFAAGPLLITPTLIALGTRGALLLALPVVIMSLAVTAQLPRIAAERIPHPHGAHHLAMAAGREQWGAFARLTGVVVLRSVVFFGLNTFIPLYWAHVLRGSRAGGGYALATMLGAVVLGTLLGGRMADRFGRRIVVVVSMAALAPILFVFLSAHALALAGVLLIPVGIALAASTSVVVVMAQEYLPDRVGLAAGVTLGLSMTIGGLLMPAFGAVADHYGLSTAMTLLAVVPMLAFVLSLTLRETSEPARA
ncbi:MAG TPA: MFS transporter [Candidatus Binataceae bacterium]|nr:MFS transporter [Candidatus Binataceae bacterium]